MSYRTICISGVCKLDLKLGFMVVRKDGVSKVALNEMSTLILDSTAISLTTSLLNELTRRKIKVVFCDEKHNPSSELLAYYGSHDSSLKIKQQILWHQEIKTLVWTKIVKEKIKKQMLNLENFGFEKEAKMLSGYFDNVMPDDTTNREGHAAKVYFNALFGLKFNRDSDLPINSALNYGYAILLSNFNKEIVASGYLTQLGLFHDNRFNPFNLASDLMEVFRPLVDKKVYNLMPMRFEKEQKAEILQILNEKVFISGKEQFLQNAISIFVKNVLNALNNGAENLLEFYDEL